MSDATGKSRWGTPWRAGLLLGLAAAAYVPSLSGAFVSDDFRFIVQNERVHELSLGNVVRVFTDPSAQATEGFDIYRPLRTLDFMIDWGLAGANPTFFRIRNLLYHLLGTLLVLALLRRLGAAPAPALFGAALFSLHPVHTESVAFIASRADLLMLVLTVSALLLHLDGRVRGAAVALGFALLAKEVAIVFPALALLADRFVGRRPAFRTYALYAALAAAFVVLWVVLVALGQREGVAQVPVWPGGSWAANLVTVGKGLLHYARELLFPVGLVEGWHVPSRSSPGLLELLLSAAGFGAWFLLWRAGGAARFAALWFGLALLPVSGLVLRMAIPTADRFLLLPSVGLCMLGGTLLARTRLAAPVLACFLALTVLRSLDWTSQERLVDSAMARAPTPRGLRVRAFDRIREAAAAADPETARAKAREVLRLADEFFRLYREDIQVPPPTDIAGDMYARRAEAWLHLGDPEQALAAAADGIRISDNGAAHEAASVALEWQGGLEDAIAEQERAVARGYAGPGSLRRLGELLAASGRVREEAGDREGALERFRRSWEAYPDPERNAAARDAPARIGR